MRDDVEPRFWSLTAAECAVLLASAQVGRVGLSLSALPVILPVNFVMIDGRVVFRTARGTKLDAAIEHQVVAFEADDFERDGTAGWSVLVRGVAAEMTADSSVVSEAAAARLESWALDGVADRYVAITAEQISGRRFTNLTHSHHGPV